MQFFSKTCKSKISQNRSLTENFILPICFFFFLLITSFAPPPEILSLSISFLFYLPFTFSFSLSSFSKWPKPASFCLFLFCCVRLSISFLFYLPFSFSFSLSLFLNGPTLASFCLFLFSFNNNLNGKIVDFSTGFKHGSLEYAS